MLMYAVVPADAQVPDLTGVSGRRLETVSGVGAAVVVEECDLLPVTDRWTVVRFADILTELSRSGPLLPVRFPTALPDRDEVRDELRRRAAGWAHRLDELSGAVEMVLRANPNESNGTGSTDGESGEAYLRRRAAAVRASQVLVTDLRRTVEPWCREVRRLPTAQGVRLACLLPRDSEHKLRHALDEWRERNGGRGVMLSGPWPPFSFVDEPEGPRHD